MRCVLQPLELEGGELQRHVLCSAQRAHVSRASSCTRSGSTVGCGAYVFLADHASDERAQPPFSAHIAGESPTCTATVAVGFRERAAHQSCTIILYLIEAPGVLGGCLASRLASVCKRALLAVRQLAHVWLS
mmetsp:Transcript_7289/g.22552  ORF Transcript_7289/g.22552 Transcript_7289/m.22552 type:complete len:132 (-) Transcript_7289:25-420(-)